MMSSPSLMRSVRYGSVWKKLKLTAAITAAVTPARRPPTTAAATTNTTRINATLVLPMVSLTATSSRRPR